MIESILFLIATTFLTILAFIMVLMYFNIIKFDVEKKAKVRKLTKEERKQYGWVEFDFNFNILGKKFVYKTKKKDE